MAAAGFRRLGRRELWRGAIVSVAEVSCLAPDGETFSREVVGHPGAVGVVAVDNAGGVVFVRQYRAAVDAELLEIPAGKRDVAAEPPEATARRELEEEVGLRAASMERLASFHTTPGFCDEVVVAFLARGLQHCRPRRQGVEERHLEVVRHGLDDVGELIGSGQLRDAKSIVAVLLARARLRGGR